GVARLAQQEPFEAPQGLVDRGAGRERRERGLVAVEERRMGILARKEPNEQLVHVEGAEERLPGGRGEPAPPFRARQRAQLVAPAPPDQQRLELEQDGP